jgi:hypothetical protein
MAKKKSLESSPKQRALSRFFTTKSKKPKSIKKNAPRDYQFDLLIKELDYVIYIFARKDDKKKDDKKEAEINSLTVGSEIGYVMQLQNFLKGSKDIKLISLIEDIRANISEVRQIFDLKKKERIDVKPDRPTVLWAADQLEDILNRTLQALQKNSLSNHLDDLIDPEDFKIRANFVNFLRSMKESGIYRIDDILSTLAYLPDGSWELIKGKIDFRDSKAEEPSNIDILANKLIPSLKENRPDLVNFFTSLINAAKSSEPYSESTDKAVLETLVEQKPKLVG